MTAHINGTTGVDVVQDASINPAKTTGMRVLKQVQTFQTGTVATGTTIIPTDNTIPQNTEGTEFMKLPFTPSSATSTLEIEVIFNGSHSVGNFIGVALFQDSIANALSATMTYVGTATGSISNCQKYIMTSGTTSSTTFKVRAGSGSAGTMTFNGLSGGQNYGGVMASRITIKEWLA